VCPEKQAVNKENRRGYLLGSAPAMQHASLTREEANTRRKQNQKNQPTKQQRTKPDDGRMQTSIPCKVRNAMQHNRKIRIENDANKEP
jgi:hypothetical protein